MLRSVIVFSPAPSQGEPPTPIAVLAEDEQGVWIEPLPGASGPDWWCTRGRGGGDHPVIRCRSVPAPDAPDHTRLEFYTQMSLSEAMSRRCEYGRITTHFDARGSAQRLAAKLARKLAPAGGP